MRRFTSKNYNIFSKSVVSHFVSSGCSEEHISLYYNIYCTLVTSHEHRWTPGLHSPDDGVLNHTTVHISRLIKMYCAVFLLPKYNNGSKQIYRYNLLLLDFVHRVTDIKHQALCFGSWLCFRLQAIDQAILSHWVPLQHSQLQVSS
jgi:hypothetical protein